LPDLIQTVLASKPRPANFRGKSSARGGFPAADSIAAYTKLHVAMEAGGRIRAEVSQMTLSVIIKIVAALGFAAGWFLIKVIAVLFVTAVAVACAHRPFAL
jgi:hypothetical protein